MFSIGNKCKAPTAIPAASRRVGPRPALISESKTETAGHLQILDRLLTATAKETRLIGLIESARGLAAVETIADATPRLTRLMLGAADMAADLGAKTAWEPLLFAHFRLIAACALAGITPIDAPFFDIRDGAGLEHEVAAAVVLGFAAKVAIHPGQVDAINAALTLLRKPSTGLARSWPTTPKVSARPAAR